MSIKIRQGSTTKSVIDVTVGTSGTTKKDVNKVVDWNGNVIWQRGIELTTTNTRFTVDSWYESDSSGFGLGRSKPYKTYSGDGHIEFYNGSSWIPLDEDKHYSVRWEDNRVPPYPETTTGTATGYGKVFVEGIASGGYTGSFYRTFFISYTYTEPVVQYTISTSVSPESAGTVSGGGKYNSGATCTLTASPASGYTFSKWSDETTDNPKSFTVTGNASYTAYFTQPTPPTKPKITGITGINMTVHTAQVVVGGKKYTPCYMALDSVFSNGIVIKFDDGTTQTMTGIEMSAKGITYSVEKGSQITVQIAVLDDVPVTSGWKYSMYDAKISISADGVTYTGSAIYDYYYLQKWG